MPTITPDEARDRFGPLLHAATRTYREFEDTDGGGIWRPVIVDGEVVSYRLHQVHKVKKRSWSKRR